MISSRKKPPLAELITTRLPLHLGRKLLMTISPGPLKCRRISTRLGPSFVLRTVPSCSLSKHLLSLRLTLQTRLLLSVTFVLLHLSEPRLTISNMLRRVLPCPVILTVLPKVILLFPDLLTVIKTPLHLYDTRTISFPPSHTIPHPQQFQIQEPVSSPIPLLNVEPHRRPNTLRRVPCNLLIPARLKPLRLQSPLLTALRTPM